MSVSTLPPYQDLHTLSGAERAAIFDLLFEPSEALHTLVSEALQGDSYDDLIANVGTRLKEAAELAGAGDLVWLESILASHPRLGEKKVESAQSRAEQAQLQSDTGADQEMLRMLNALYEDTFPGLRFIRAVIMEEMQVRIQRGDIRWERSDAIKVRQNFLMYKSEADRWQAMCEIATDRARKLGTENVNAWKHAYRVSQLSESTSD